MMANTVDMQQLLMSIDPSSGNQELFNQMSKGGLLTSGGSASPSSLASSGAPSSSSVLNEGCNNDDKDQNGGNGTGSWLSMLMQQQQQKMNGSDLMEMVQQNPQLFEMLTQNGSTDLAALVGQLTGAKKMNDNDCGDDRDGSVSPPASAAPSSLAGIMLPTTSSHHNSTDSAHQSVIVNGGGQNNDDDLPSSPPVAKKSKTSDENSTSSALLKNAIDNMLFAQISSSLSGQLPGQQQNPNIDKDLLFGGLFPQSMAGLPLMFQSPLHSQFAGLSDFDSPLSALSTPNKSGAVKRQYSSNGKNYCNLCNKEVCNKYFLRTHMLKMHGIVIDENKTVIANIDTLERERMGNLSFRCDTCMVEFKSRTQLRQHKQDVHGVMPISTARSSNNGKPSLPSTPTLNSAPTPGLNGTNGGNSTTSNEEKCQICDKRVPSVMMGIHVQQEHLGGAGGTQLASMSAPDLTQVMALLNQATRGVSHDSDDGTAAKRETSQDLSLLKCTRCQYATKDQRNLDLHQERHEQLNEVKRRGSDEDEDEALKMTTEAALKMVVQNQFDGSDIGAINSTAAALNLSLHKGIKKETQCEEEKIGGAQHERNSHTSGSISPSGDSIPEGFGKPIGNEKNFPVQTFIVRSNDDKGCFLGEFIAQLPVRSLVNGPRQVVFELLPTSNVPNGV